jgi:hypothetical protein
MKGFKIVVLTVLALVTVILITAAFMKRDYSVTRSIIIQRELSPVFMYLKSLKSQNDWSVWGKRDPNMTSEFIGEDGTEGCISKWKGNDEVGEGEQEMMKIVEGKRIENELRFKTPWESTSKAIFTTVPIDDSSTQVSWILEGTMPYPSNIMSLFMNMDEMIGKDFEEGLANLKVKLEQEIYQ